MYHSVASGASYEGVYYLSIHENGLVEINDVIVSIDAPLQIAGYCTYLGTTELGMVYQFGLYSGDQLRALFFLGLLSQFFQLQRGLLLPAQHLHQIAF